MQKKIKWAACAMMSLLLVTGCSGAKLPEGDVKVVNQQVSGVIDLLLQSADYGGNQSTVTSMLLPTGSSYDIKMAVEQYEAGQLVNTIEVPTYTTEEMEKNSLIHLILNIGKEDVKSIFSIAEVDNEKTTDKKNPEYKMEKTNAPAINFEKRVTLDQYGGELGKEFVLAAYTTGGSSDMNLETYQDELANYETASIVKVTITKK
ncbi:MAG: hypothetical protein HFE54_02930 [Turicibacter sp.]|jgi:hypothetical protein|uniref:Lipoprotein n=1 Tax=Turicibacter faecis TaxID=2963365 RepID=A0ABM8IMK2_9FIRM|nr:MULTISPECIES: hypothetical protein [unclassified Turicibacter]MCI8701688.1 hypothetical protein [Turicibacter sp.]BEH90584.1 hypothetical protein T23_06860 [Turicibacter sp. TC023]MCI9350878.1 hypothetical protein [Turicibacter sp.]MCU7208361.1 hypothetical protein [Turicibacter sp. 1E2]NCE79300.1 hypothetical protein [Turicibacter sp. TS3]